MKGNKETVNRKQTSQQKKNVRIVLVIYWYNK